MGHFSEIEFLTNKFNFFAQAVLILVLASARSGIVLTIVPFFGANGLPRHALLMVMLFVIVPMTLPTLPEGEVSVLFMAALALKEVLIGILIGFFVSIAFWGLEAAGELIDLQRGTTAGSIFNPTFGAIESPLGGLFLRLAGFVFISTGGFTALLAALLASYEMYPIGKMLPAFTADWKSPVFHLMDQLFQMAVLYAAPLLIVFFFMDFGLGLMNRFVSQLNVFFLSLPIKSGLCFFMLLFYQSFLLEGFHHDVFTVQKTAAFLRIMFR